MKEKILKRVKDNKHFVLLFICIAIFIIILTNVLNSNISKFDEIIYRMVISVKKETVTNVFKTITQFGSAIGLVLIALISLILCKNKKVVASIAINLASCGLLNHILKIVIQRQRPPLEYRMVEESSFSFPSGHSMSSIAFYGLIIYFVFKNMKNIKLRNIICMALGLLIFFIGLSRIYLGVHYASDVLAGFVLGLAYLIIYITFILKLFKVK